ncbi:predicted protein [Botrytis cinerea T4]|uniref:Uncharacterized protein n=1 Tax=Botryotinia fuckeliana (strain T4) TaxID=999810 RepID=G2YI78_BOTF4|nr:predicted protein [Botrytis cinerea T4]
MFFLFSTNSTWGGASSSSASISYSRSARVKQIMDCAAPYHVTLFYQQGRLNDICTHTLSVNSQTKNLGNVHYSNLIIS